MAHDRDIDRSFRRPIYGFVAGFLATLTFHQIALWLLWVMQIAPFAPFNMAATQPWGIPALFSLATWGGIWGIIFAFIQSYFPRGKGYWIRAFLFGAIFPSIGALLMVLPMKGYPAGGGWHWQLLLTAFLINGVWGVGTGFLIRAFYKYGSLLQHKQPSDCPLGMNC
jgi:hypothetical protein